MKNTTSILIGIIILVILAGSIFFFTGGGSSNNPSINSETNNGNNGSTSSGNAREINIINFAFDPIQIIIKKGDTVKWTNMDSVKHTVTSDSGSELDSALLGQGESYSHTFNSAEIYTYHCAPHPNMKGTIVVQ